MATFLGCGPDDLVHAGDQLVVAVTDDIVAGVHEAIERGHEGGGH